MTHLDFVLAWLECRMGGAKAVAARLGKDTHWINCTAARLRRLGVDLPPMPRIHPGGPGRNRRESPAFTDTPDVAALNKFITER